MTGADARGESACWRHNLRCRDRRSLRQDLAGGTSQQLPHIEASHAICRLRRSEFGASWLYLRVSCACLLTAFVSLIVMRVFDDVHIGKHNQALLHHVVEDGNECLEFLFHVDDGEQNWPVVGEAERRVLMNSSIGAVAKNAPIDGDTGDIVSS